MCLFIWSNVKFKYLFSILESKAMENISTLLRHLVMYAQLRDSKNYLTCGPSGILTEEVVIVVA